MASNIVFTAEKTEISEQQSFSIRRTGWDTWDATLPWDSLSDCIMTITAAFSTPAGQTARGVLYQVHNNSGNYRPMSQLQWLDTNGAEYILSIHTDELVLLAAVLTDLAEFEGVALDLDMSEMEWRHFEANVRKVLGEEGLNGLEPRVTSLEGAVTSLDARTDALEAGAVGLDARVDSLEDLTNTGRLSDASLTAKITDNAGINIHDYGVITDGSVTTGASLQAAMVAAAAQGLPLRLPKGRYLIDQVNVPSGLILQGSGPDTVLVQRLADKTILQAAGTFADGPVLTETLAKGATTINVTNTYAAGDLIIVRDDASYVSTDAGYKSGEMLEVLSATGSVITLKWPVRGSFQSGGGYTVANNSRLVKLTPNRNISIRDMTFECHPGQLVQATTFIAVDGLTVSGIQVTKGQNTFMGIDCCKDVDVDQWKIVETVDNIGTGRPGYGFAIKQACYNVKIHNGTDHMSRHPITTMGGAYGIPRLLEFYGITSSALNSTAGIDTHAAGEGILIYGNIVTGNNSLGITVRARNVTVYGNLIIGCSSAGVIITESARDVEVHGNTILDCGYGVRVGSSTFVHSNVTVSYNVIKRTKLWSGDSGSGKAIAVSAAAHDNINISYNEIENVYGSGIVFPAQVESGSVVYNTVINASTGAGNPPYLDLSGGTSGAGSVDVIGNVMRNVLGTPGRAIHTTRTAGRMVLNVATGAYISTGTEFNAPVGWTKLDNKLYA